MLGRAEGIALKRGYRELGIVSSFGSVFIRD